MKMKKIKLIIQLFMNKISSIKELEKNFLYFQNVFLIKNNFWVILAK